ncbi:MAG TPA: hypothetical protein DCW90_00150, partial [Lachnospiraceae bacterium]|nr:hypothetical protein [Lachnospiraceae bacterium]
MKNNIRDLNEQVANLYVAKVMEITAAFAIVVIILNTIGIFVVDPAIMTITGSTSLIALLIPAFILKVLKKNEVWLKYVAIFSASVVVLTITVTLNY